MKRVIFDNNPLFEVILQFRFPAILSINVNEPIEFQDKIRHKFPIYQPTTENQQEIQLVANNDSFLPSIVNKQQNKNYAFISADGKTKINLTSTFISISTVDYIQWELFWQEFQDVLENFISIYQPAFFERIGLRYIDAISKTSLNLSEKSWSDLIQPNWLGPLTYSNDSDVVNTSCDAEYILPSGSRVKIHTGLGNVNEQPEKVFIIDTDLIRIEQIPIDGYTNILDDLHTNSKVFIERVITEELYSAMNPRS